MSPAAPPSEPATLDYRAILDQTTDAIFISNASGTLLDVNVGACQLLGYARDELIGKHFGDIVSERSQAQSPLRYEELRRARTLRGEREYVRKDGSRLTVEVSAAVISSNYILAIARDVGERVRAQQELSREATLLDGQNQILEMIAAGEPLDVTLDAVARMIDAQHPESMASILLTDEGGRRLVSKAAPRLPREFADYVAVVDVGPDTGSCGTAAYLRRPVIVSDIATDPKWAPFRDMALRHDLRACWSSPVLARSGQVLGTFALYYAQPASPNAFELRLIGVATRLVALAVEGDRGRAALVRSNDALRAVVDNAPIAIMVIDTDRRVVSWNPASERIFGYTEEEAVGRRVAELMVPPERAADHEEFWRRAMSGESLNGIEVARQRKDGSRLDMALWISPLHGPDGAKAGMLAFCADVTGPARLREQLLRGQRMESIGRLAGGISHDFNNLLAVISGYSESLLRRTTPDNPLRDHAEEIHRAASRGAALTQQLLAFSRRQSAAPRVIDLSRAVHDTYSMLRRLISEKIDIELSAPAPVMVRADAGQLEQVLVNLAINARDAMPETGGKISILTERARLAPGEVQGLEPGDYARLSVCDTGFGMDAATSARIFDPFFSTKEPGAGTGLGLSIVYGIVQQAGGNISVRSSPGAGCRFDIFLPAAPVPA